MQARTLKRFALNVGALLVMFAVAAVAGVLAAGGVLLVVGR